VPVVFCRQVGIRGNMSDQKSDNGEAADSLVGASTEKIDCEVPAMGTVTPKEFCNRFLTRDHESEKFILEGQIGQGGMGAIYRVTDQDLHRVSVLKVILPDVMEDAALFHRFVAEARITAGLEHPNIIPVHDLGALGGTKPYFSMKLVQGESLAAILRTVRDNNEEYVARYSLYSLLSIFRKVCDAVAFAHSRRIIHRDIKPDNIMVARYGEVLLMDWGLARNEYRTAAGDGDGDDDGNDSNGLPGDDEDPLRTRFGVIKGTPSYMAPEQARGFVEEIDRRSDIFLLGATLYTIATLHPPYGGDGIYEVLTKAEQGNFVQPGLLAPERQLPEELCRIITKAMAHDQEDRYQSVEDLSTDIDALLEGCTESVPRTFAPGEFLMREGETGTEAYLIVSGGVEVVKEVGGKTVTLIRLGAGDAVGEMALIVKAPRSASVKAIQETRVVVITADLIRQGLDKVSPWMGKVIEALVNRLRSANDNVHPLMRGDCTYHVVSQLRLLYMDRGVAATDGRSEKPTVILDTGATIREISALLCISQERVTTIVSRLLQGGLLRPSGSDGFMIPNLELFARFGDYLRRELNVDTGFQEDRNTVMFTCNDAVMVRHWAAGDAESADEIRSVVQYAPEKVFGCESADEIAAKFEQLHRQIQVADAEAWQTDSTG